jgi:type I restriction enzyme, S subunit
LLLDKWIELVINSDVGREYFAGASKQTTNLASINMTQLRSFPLPVPPLSEQTAILQQLSRLATICKALKANQTEAKRAASFLAMSAVGSITGVTVSREDNRVKLPKTELVSILVVSTRSVTSDLAPLTTILIRNDGQLPAKTLWNISGLDIDAFYQQLKTEMAKGWIVQPEVAYMREEESS